MSYLPGSEKQGSRDWLPSPSLSTFFSLWTVAGPWLSLSLVTRLPASIFSEPPLTCKPGFQVCDVAPGRHTLLSFPDDFNAGLQPADCSSPTEDSESVTSEQSRMLLFSAQHLGKKVSKPVQWPWLLGWLQRAESGMVSLQGYLHIRSPIKNKGEERVSWTLDKNAWAGIIHDLDISLQGSLWANEHLYSAGRKQNMGWSQYREEVEF